MKSTAKFTYLYKKKVNFIDQCNEWDKEYIVLSVASPLPFERFFSKFVPRLLTHALENKIFFPPIDH